MVKPKFARFRLVCRTEDLRTVQGAPGVTKRRVAEQSHREKYCNNTVVIPQAAGNNCLTNTQVNHGEGSVIEDRFNRLLTTRLARRHIPFFGFPSSVGAPGVGTPTLAVSAVGGDA